MERNVYVPQSRSRRVTHMGVYERVYIYLLNVSRGVSRCERDLHDPPGKPDGKGSVRVPRAAYLTLGKDVSTGKNLCSGRARVGDRS